MQAVFLKHNTDAAEVQNKKTPGYLLGMLTHFFILAATVWDETHQQDMMHIQTPVLIVVFFCFIYFCGELYAFLKKLLTEDRWQEISGERWRTT